MDAVDRSIDELAIELGRVALARGEMIAGAESCTGGLIAGAITSVSGSSQWFDRGFVTYSNDAKQAMLGVAAETLQAFGAVSEETAREMALGALNRSGGTLSFAVTGVAGPTGGTSSKPVGMVCFGFSDTRGVRTATVHFSGDRASVREQSVIYVLKQLIQQIHDAAR